MKKEINEDINYCIFFLKTMKQNSVQIDGHVQHVFSWSLQVG